MFTDHPTVALDPIPGFPGYYANRLGIIFSAYRRGLRRRSYPKPLYTNTDKHGYKIATLFRDGKHYRRAVHRLILETYVGPRPEGKETRHLNNNPPDNRLSNLRWGTHRENLDDIIRAGSCKGINSSRARLTDDDIRIIRTISGREAIRRYGITKQNAWSIRNRRTWAHVT